MTTTIEHLETLTAYVPPPVASLAFQNPHQLLGGTWRRFHAITIFADISGFTPLAEALASSGLGGAEELNAILNQVFEALITTIESHGGQVVSFGGDALSLIWPYQPEHMKQTAWRVLQAAFAMQSTIAGFTIIPTSQGEFDIQMKVGISVGEILEVHAGGELDRLEYVLAGTPMANMSQAENLAKAGEIVVDENIWQLVNGLELDAAKQITASAIRQQSTLPDSYIFGEKAAPGFYRVTHLWSKLPPVPLTSPDWAQLDLTAATKVDTTLRCYIPGAISSILKDRHTTTLTELKSMTVCFVGFSGLDYNNDPEAGPRLNNFLRDAQKAIYRYEGSINKLDVGDKGSVLLVLFGAPPLFHEDDEARAVACALDLVKVAVHHELKIRIGLTAGPLFLGPLGASRRREYTAIGDVVNLAARLMQKAEASQIWVDESVQSKAEQLFEFQDLGHIQVKGKTKPRHVYLALGKKIRSQKMSVMTYLLRSQKLTGPDQELGLAGPLSTL
jgi:class 3 adenylate cyclase